jgi:phosphoesterase RecJ-like protein
MQAAATAEIIYELLQKMQIPLTKEMAYCIFTGLSTDTGSFKYSNTTATTMRIAAKLLEMGVDPSVISDNIELKKPFYGHHAEQGTANFNLCA